MSIMRSTGSPDRGNNPAERGENHIDDGAKHENMERAEPITEPAEKCAERGIAEAENEPSDKARRQQMPRKAQKPKNGNRSEEAQNHRGGDIALQRKGLQEGGMIGNSDPGGENQGQTNTNVNTGANRRVAEDMEPAIPRQMRTNQHEVHRLPRCEQSFNPDLRRWLRDLDNYRCAGLAFIPHAVYGGRGVPIAVAGVYRPIPNRGRGQQFRGDELAPYALLLTSIEAVTGPNG